MTIYSGDIQNYMYNHHQPRNIMFSVRYVFNKARSKYKGERAGKNEKRRMQAYRKKPAPVLVPEAVYG